jgi:Spy/CpxP family protein refolding chaperone
MKKPWFIMLGGLLAGVAAYAFIYLTGTAEARAVSRSKEPVLAWLQREYHLSDEQYARIRDLHEAYRPKCAEMCRKIAEKNAEVERLLAATNVITPEIKAVLSEAAQLRAQCQANMLAHFYAVARTMPPAQGQRYLTWVRQETLAPAQMMPSRPPPSSAGTTP